MVLPPPPVEKFLRAPMCKTYCCVLCLQLRELPCRQQQQQQQQQQPAPRPPHHPAHPTRRNRKSQVASDVRVYNTSAAAVLATVVRLLCLENASSAFSLYFWLQSTNVCQNPGFLKENTTGLGFFGLNWVLLGIFKFY